MRITRAAAAAALAVPVVLASGAVPALLAPAVAAETQLTWCAPVAPTYPCVAEASRNGTPILPTDPVWSVTGIETTAPGESSWLRVELRKDDSDDLGEAARSDTFAVKVRTTQVPRVVSGKARDAVVTRSESGGVHTVEVTAKPVLLAGQCDQSVWPWVCPEDGGGTDPTNWRQWEALWSLDVTDYASWEDADQRASMFGMNYLNNIAATSIPPEVDFDSAGVGSLLIRMANRHFLDEGVTPVSGRAELTIPNAFLEEVYGIPDPATMSGSSLVASGSAAAPGTVSITQNAAGTAMLVTVDGISFSTKVLRVKRGVIVPTRPTQVSATRTGRGRGFVDFEPAQPRGAEVTGYAARCVRRGHVVTGSAPNIVRVTGLRAGKPYQCTVRARSQAGFGPWSAPARMPARP